MPSSFFADRKRIFEVRCLMKESAAARNMSSPGSVETVEGLLGAQEAEEIVEDLPDVPYLRCTQQGIGILAQEAGFDKLSTKALDCLTQLWVGMTRQIAVEMHSSTEASGRSVGSKVDLTYALAEIGMSIEGLGDYVELLKANADYRRLALPLPDPTARGFEPKRHAMEMIGYTQKTIFSIFDHLPPIPDITKKKVIASKFEVPLSEIPRMLTRKERIEARAVATRNLHEFYLRADENPLEMKAAIIQPPSLSQRVTPAEWTDWTQARDDWVEGRISSGRCVIEGEKEDPGDVVPSEEEIPCEEKDDSPEEEGRQGRRIEVQTKVKALRKELLNPPMPPATMMDVPIVHPALERQPYLGALLAKNTKSQRPKGMDSTRGASLRPRSHSIGRPMDSTLYSSLYTIQQLDSWEKRKHGFYDVSSSSESDAEPTPGTDRAPISALKKAARKSIGGAGAFSFDGGPDKAFSVQDPAVRKGRRLVEKVASTQHSPQTPRSTPGTFIVEDDDILEALTSANEELEREAVSAKSGEDESEEEFFDTDPVARKKSLREMVRLVGERDEGNSSSTESDEEIMDKNMWEYIKPLPALRLCPGGEAVCPPDTEIEDVLSNPFALPPTG